MVERRTAADRVHALRWTILQISDLPTFSIVDVHEQHCTGRFTPSPWVGERWGAALYLVGDRFLWGRFRDVDTAAGTCSFFPDEPADLQVLQQSSSYPYIDGYWGERAELVLDETRSWEKRRFNRTDAVGYPGPEGSWLVTRSLPESPSGGDIISGAWAHEHCAICWETISQHGQPEGYFNAPNTWICPKCYTTYVLPRSLAFIPTET
jgi:hypothetical protein